MALLASSPPHARSPVPPPHDDPVTTARRGDAGGIAAIYRAYAAGLTRAAWRITGSQADAEDVVHDVFVALPDLLARYEERDRLDAWLRGVVVRRAVALLRRERRRAGLLARFLPFAIARPAEESHTALRVTHAGAVATGDDPTDTADRETEHAIDVAALERAVASLPEALRVVFVLRHYEHLSHEAIAAHLNITPGAARVRLSRAIARLRTHLSARVPVRTEVPL